MLSLLYLLLRARTSWPNLGRHGFCVDCVASERPRHGQARAPLLWSKARAQRSVGRVAASNNSSKVLLSQQLRQDQSLHGRLLET